MFFCSINHWISMVCAFHEGEHIYICVTQNHWCNIDCTLIFFHIDLKKMRGHRRNTCPICCQWPILDEHYNQSKETSITNHIGSVLHPKIVLLLWEVIKLNWLFWLLDHLGLQLFPEWYGLKWPCMLGVLLILLPFHTFPFTHFTSQQPWPSDLQV